MSRLCSLSVLLFALPALLLSAAVGEDPAAKEHDRQHEARARHVHDEDYDHEAFLGQDDAEEFEKLSPEESVERLAKIVDRIDKDGDGYITFDEMRAWIQFTQQRYISEDVDRQWQQHNVAEGDNKLDWKAYRELVYGFLDDETADNKEEEDEHMSYKKMEDRDRRRWDLADEDKDGKLEKTEFQNFLHPEEADHMRDVVVQETLEDIDRDGDGQISLEEYIGDMYRGDPSNPGEEPEWVAHERAQFEEHRDKNKDGHMDIQEVKDWIIPPDFDHSEAEAKHLIFEADEDHDLKLTKDEVLDKYDLFVGSQATDFGEALSRHDEF